MPGTKHLIQCHCILPQFRNMDKPLFHKFTVFSEFDSEGEIIPKIAKCNNCGVIHRVVDFCRSEIITNLEDSSVISSINEVKQSLPDSLCKVLEESKSDLATWEQVDNIFENEEWNSTIVLGKQTIEDETHVKVLSIIGPDKYKIRNHIRQETIG